MSRPVRLSPDEALALVVALRMLADVPGLTDREVVSQTLAKVAGAAGDAATAVGQVSVQTSVVERDAERFARIVSGLRAVRLTYYNAGRDETTERVVDPMRVMLAEGHAYLVAWCRRAEGVRRFRIDRIDSHTVLDEPAVIPDGVREDNTPPGAAFAGDASLPLVVIRVTRAARWVGEYYPCDDMRPDGDGYWRITLRARDLAWAKRLVLGLGTDAEVLRPADLRADVAATARAALRAYED